MEGFLRDSKFKLLVVNCNTGLGKRLMSSSQSVLTLIRSGFIGKVIVRDVRDLLELVMDLQHFTL